MQNVFMIIYLLLHFIKRFIVFSSVSFSSSTVDELLSSRIIQMKMENNFLIVSLVCAFSVWRVGTTGI